MEIKVVRVAHLVDDVVHAVVLGAGHEVRGVVIGVAAQEDEEVADGVRPLETQQLLVELLHRRQLADERGHVAELGGTQRGVALDAARVLRGEQVQRHARARLLEHQYVGRAGGDVAAALYLVPGVAQPALCVVERLPDLIADGRALCRSKAADLRLSSAARTR
jgi:hypothetical protein